MLMPQEIEVWYILPAIRREFVKELQNEGLKQREIAKKLSITDASVSYYLRNKRAKEITFNKKIMKNIKKSVKNILHGSCYIKEIQNNCSLIKKEGVLCKVHKSKDNIKNCGACL